MAKQKGYAKTDNKIIRDPSLTMESRQLYTILASYCDKNRECYPSIDQLLRDTGISKDRLYRHMRILEQRGIIEKFYSKSDTNKFGKLTYRLCDFKE